MSQPQTLASVPTNTVNNLHPELQTELDKIRVKKAFNPNLWLIPRCQELLRYLKKYNIKTTVLAVSGGVDSAAVLALLKLSQDLAKQDPTHPFNPTNGGKIIGIAQPIYSTPEIQNRAFEVIEKLFSVTLDNNKCIDCEGLKFVTVDQSEDYDLKVRRFERTNGHVMKPFAAAMLKSYMRTTTNYEYALNFGGVVIGTGNLDEDGYLYYYCKFGDGAVDLGLIWDLHKSEVFTLARHIGVPESILIAPPSADLAPGQTDETEIGTTYNSVELVYNYIVNYSQEERESFIATLSEEAKNQFDREKAIIDSIHNKGAHKADLNPKNMGKYQF
jgi:NAD+ synthase (glutamine-hydrolysing)